MGGGGQLAPQRPAGLTILAGPAADPAGPTGAAQLRGEAVACERCGLLLAVRTTHAVVAVGELGGLLLDPAAIRCGRCGAVWSNLDGRRAAARGGRR